MAVGAKHKVTVGEVEKAHEEEVRVPEAAEQCVLFFCEIPAACLPAVHTPMSIQYVVPLGPATARPCRVAPECSLALPSPCHQVSRLIMELAVAGQAELGITLDAGYVERLLAYARSVSHFPTALKEFPWRNGWFQGISRRYVDEGKPDPMPQHSALLAELNAA